MINKRMLKRYSVKRRDEMAQPHTVERIRVPLPKDLDKAVRIELKSKLTGEVGFQLIKAGNTRLKRFEFLNKEFEDMSEMRFRTLTFVDRAMVSQPDDSHYLCGER